MAPRFVNVGTLVLAFNHWLASRAGFLQACVFVVLWTGLVFLGFDPTGFWFLYAVSALAFIAMFAIAGYAQTGAHGAAEAAARGAQADFDLKEMLHRLDESDQEKLQALQAQEAVLEAVAANAEQTLELLREGTAIAGELAKFERRVVERHRLLAEQLPDAIKLPLLEAFEAPLD